MNMDLIACIFLGVFGLALISLALAFGIRLVRHLRRQQTWTPTEATITDVEIAPRGMGDSLIAHYSYLAADGSEQSGRDSAPDATVDLDERRLSIVVDPKDSARSAIAAPLPMGTTIAFAVGSFIFLLIGTGMISVSLRLLSSGGI